jgi:N,N'-diacetyllegionaminate synthase
METKHSHDHWIVEQQNTSACTLIAEVAQAHDGSLGMAHAFIDAAASAGVDAVKFQTHIAAEESTLSEPWRVKFSRQDETRFDYCRPGGPHRRKGLDVFIIGFFPCSG